MAVDSANTLIRRLRNAAGLLEPGLTDSQLLGRFAADRDEAAFAELVRRHGSMVLGVCRRVAGDSDADDAFQATFIVLARKACGLGDQPSLGAWLYGVAYRAALKAKAVARKRRAKEAAAARTEGVAEMAEPSDVLAVIEQELGRLPKRYREPLVLCGLCGRSRKEVAEELGIPEGTLASRLAKAREMLAERLRRRGLVVPGGVAAVTACEQSATATVPAALADATVKAATGTVPAVVGRIASEVTKAMFLNKLRTTVLLLAAGAVACAAGWLALSHATANPYAPITANAPVPPAANKVADGVYLLKFEGEGQNVTLTDGSEAVLGKQLSRSIGTGVKLRSWTNDNTRFHLHVKGLGPLPNEVTEVQTALVVGGVVLHVGRPEKFAEDRTVEIGANVYSSEAATTIAAGYKIEPQFRKHPGHRVEVRWVPDKKEYEVGEAVKLKMELKNTGTGQLRFTHGGQQRGARDNQFRFVAQEGSAGKGLPDTGNPDNHGGKVRMVTLKPGEIYTAEVELSKWFKFTEPNNYRITGVFEMPVIDPLGESFDPVIWDDLAVGECSIHVRAKKK